MAERSQELESGAQGEHEVSGEAIERAQDHAAGGEKFREEFTPLLTLLHHKRQEVDEKDCEILARKEEVEALRTSTSWRMTAPFRWLFDLLRGNA